jgi:hypothetical protein
VWLTKGLERQMARLKVLLIAGAFWIAALHCSN